MTVLWLSEEPLTHCHQKKKWKKGEILLIQILQYFANLEKERKRWDREKVGMDDRRG